MYCHKFMIREKFTNFDRLTIGMVILDQITDKMFNGHLVTEVKDRDRTGRYNNDYARGRSRERHYDRPVQSRQNTLNSRKR